MWKDVYTRECVAIHKSSEASNVGALPHWKDVVFTSHAGGMGIPSSHLIEGMACLHHILPPPAGGWECLHHISLKGWRVYITSSPAGWGGMGIPSSHVKCAQCLSLFIIDRGKGFISQL